MSQLALRTHNRLRCGRGEGTALGKTVRWVHILSRAPFANRPSPPAYSAALHILLLCDQRWPHRPTPPGRGEAPGAAVPFRGQERVGADPQGGGWSDRLAAGLCSVHAAPGSTSAATKDGAAVKKACLCGPSSVVPGVVLVCASGTGGNLLAAAAAYLVQMLRAECQKITHVQAQLSGSITCR